jgi:tetratricopeptide (TPR) repeat protein
VKLHNMNNKLSLFWLVVVSAIAFPLGAFAQKGEAAKLTREGAEALKSKNYDQAVELFRRAAEMDRHNVPGLSAALQQRAMALAGRNQYQRAIEDFNAALDLSPDDAGIYERRAYVEMKLGDYDHALADYNELIKRKSNEVRYYLLRSYIYEVKGDLANGLTDCDKVLQIQKNNQEAKARKERLQKLQAQQMPAGPITAPPPQQPAPQPKKP